MITKYIIGDITETELKYIAHGVNCQNKMGSGVAKALYEKFPQIKPSYHNRYMRLIGEGKDPNELLGIISAVYSQDKIIFNMFTQLNYGYDGKKYVNYASIVTCFNNLVKSGIKEPIAIPKIGCGLAGGDWKFVEQLINDTVGNDLEIWVYELEGAKTSGKNDLG
jgi:O-acetyl-ADP-ribose deacetylase (regulator of RNase III)